MSKLHYALSLREILGFTVVHGLKLSLPASYRILLHLKSRVTPMYEGQSVFVQRMFFNAQVISIHRYSIQWAP